jgi:hypothetical protein
VPRKALLVAVAPLALAALAGPSCGSDSPAGGPNAPCTRSSDCEGDLVCENGVCVSPRAALPPPIISDSGFDSGVADGPDAD